MQILIVMVIYITILISWGIYLGIKVKKSSGFAITGRKLPDRVTALSEKTTGESS